MEKSMDAKISIAESIANEYKAWFPNSLVQVGRGCLGDGVSVSCYLGNQKTFSNGISQNDEMGHTYWIYDSEKGYEVTCDGISLMTQPSESESHLAYGRVKMSFRKKNNSKDKVLKAMFTHIEKLRSFVDENKNKLWDKDFKTLDAEGIFNSPNISSNI